MYTRPNTFQFPRLLWVAERQLPKQAAVASAAHPTPRSPLFPAGRSLQPKFAFAWLYASMHSSRRPYQSSPRRGMHLSGTSYVCYMYAVIYTSVHCRCRPHHSSPRREMQACQAPHTAPPSALPRTNQKPGGVQPRGREDVVIGRRRMCHEGRRRGDFKAHIPGGGDVQVVDRHMHQEGGRRCDWKTHGACTRAHAHTRADTATPIALGLGAPDAQFISRKFYFKDIF